MMFQLTSRRLCVPLIRAHFVHSSKSLLFTSSGGSASCLRTLTAFPRLQQQQNDLKHRPSPPNGLQPAIPSLLACRSLLTFAQQPTSLVIHAQQLRALQLPMRESGDNEWEELKKLSIYQRLKILLKKYWYIAIPLHCLNSLLWFGLLYLLASFGIDGAKLIGLIQPYIVNWEHTPETIKQIFNKDPATLGNMAIALILYKLTTPARYLSTIFGTFYAVRFLLRAGIIVRSSKELSTIVKNSYISHAVNQNIQKRVKALRRPFKKPRS